MVNNSTNINTTNNVYINEILLVELGGRTGANTLAEKSSNMVMSI
jgi:hypothetical protein